MSDSPVTPTPPTDPAPLSPSSPPGAGDNSWMGLMSALCGAGSIAVLIPGFCCCLFRWLCPPLAIAGIVLGVLGLKSSKAALAKLGIGLSVAGFVLLIAMIVLSVVLGFALGGMRSLSR